MLISTRKKHNIQIHLHAPAKQVEIILKFGKTRPSNTREHCAIAVTMSIRFSQKVEHSGFLVHEDTYLSQSVTLSKDWMGSEADPVFLLTFI